MSYDPPKIKKIWGGVVTGLCWIQVESAIWRLKYWTKKISTVHQGCKKWTSMRAALVDHFQIFWTILGKFSKVEQFFSVFQARRCILFRECQIWRKNCSRVNSGLDIAKKDKHFWTIFVHARGPAGTFLHPCQQPISLWLRGKRAISKHLIWSANGLNCDISRRTQDIVSPYQ